VCSLHKKTRSMYFCKKCDADLCVVDCFEKCELESLNTKRSVDCGDARQIISLYSADRKHLLCK